MPSSLILPELMVFGLLTINSTHCSAQQATDAKKPVVFTVQQDHRHMLQQLGITKLRPGRSGDEKSPNVANYDEAKANPYPNLPDIMRTANGAQVTTPQQWWETRRPEIVELLERVVYQPREPDDWGALRVWGWGASRGLDYLETESGVDARRVGIAGVSRYGKAALVTMAFDQRFAVGLIASSGAGGAKLFRRNFGESLENLATSGGNH